MSGSLRAYGTPIGVVDTGRLGVAALAHEAGGASSRVLRATPGDLDFFIVNTGAVAGWIFLQDAAAAQGNGAISCPLKWQWPANATKEVGFNPPLKATTGWVVYFSTTGPDTLTLSATASFGGRIL